MSGFVRPTRIIALIAAAVLGGASHAAPPERVVSINLCTDQLALMLAAPEQLVSVSRLAQDDTSSVMAAKARDLPTNGSGAEEVFLLRPDLVLAGTFTSHATVQMLRDLGIAVELFAPAASLADIEARILQMGRALGREDPARTMAARFRADLAALTDTIANRPRAALYYVNSYTTGDKTLAGDILRAAGFDNLAEEAGLSFGGTLPLEQLVMLAPDVVIRGRDYPGRSRAEDTLTHPALDHLTVAGVLTDRDWICGTPHVLNAVRAMRDLRREVQQ
jgi:iron complex transport system substrate-binding protein